VTIIPRGNALGGTHMLPESERYTLPEPYLKAQLITLLAGRAAERVLLGSVSSGADDDIRRATSLARSMLMRWGMDEGLGPIDLRVSEDHPFLGQTIAQPRLYADATAARADAAVQELLKESEAEAIKILMSNKDSVLALSAELEAKETLDAVEIRKYLDPNNITPLRDTARHK
jgi:cell division protease FtsH